MRDSYLMSKLPIKFYVVDISYEGERSNSQIQSSWI
jgi:hypothetical protein